MARIKQLTSEKSSSLMEILLKKHFPNTEFNVRRDKKKTLRWCDDPNDTAPRLHVSWTDGPDYFEVSDIIRNFTLDKEYIWINKEEPSDILTTAPQNPKKYERAQLVFRSFKCTRLLSKQLVEEIYNFLKNAGAPKDMYHKKVVGGQWYISRNYNFMPSLKERSKMKIDWVMLTYIAAKLPNRFKSGDKLSKYYSEGYHFCIAPETKSKKHRKDLSETI